MANVTVGQQIAGHEGRYSSALGQSRRALPVTVTDLDIDCMTDAPSRVIEIAMSEIIDAGWPFGEGMPGSPGMILAHMDLRTIDHDTVGGSLVFEPLNFGGGTPSAYVVRSSARSYVEQTNMMPGTRELFKVAYQDITDGIHIPEDVLTIAMPFTMRALEIAVVKNGPADDSDAQYVNYVNQFEWRGRDPGSWRLDQYETQESVFQGYHTVNATALAKVGELWVYFGIMRNPNTGQYVVPPQADLDTLRDMAYAPQSVNITNAPFGKGVIRIDPHLWTNFESIFTFS